MKIVHTRTNFEKPKQILQVKIPLNMALRKIELLRYFIILFIILLTIPFTLFYYTEDDL